MRLHSPRWLVFIAVVVLTAVLLHSHRASAATFDLTVCDSDPLLNGAIFTAAVATANANGQADTIELGACTYALNGRVSFDDDGGNYPVVVNGNGATLQPVAGAADPSLLRVWDATTVTLNNMTLRNASADLGSAIYNLGSLTVNRVSFLNNSAGNSGAGIGHGGTFLRVLNSTFTGNSAFYGGAIAGFGNDAVIVNSTFSGNSTPSSGAGGAIDNTGEKITIINSTFSGNSSGFGNDLSVNGFGMDVFNSIMASGCRLARDVPFTINHSYAPSCSPGSGTGNVTSGSLNLGTLTGTPAYFPLNAGSVAINAGNNTYLPGSVSSDQAGNERIFNGTVDMGSIESNAPPASVTVTLTGGGTAAEGSTATFRLALNNAARAGGLTVNLTAIPGGGLSAGDYTLTDPASTPITTTATIPAGATSTTLTFTALNDGSSAEAAETLALALASGTGYTIGTPASGTAAIPANGLTVTNGSDMGEGSLRQAVANANSDDADSTITFSGVSTVSLTSSTLTLANNGALTVNGGSGVTVQGNNTFRIFIVNSGATVTLTGLSISDGRAFDESGGGILNDGGNLTLNNSTVSDSLAGAGGGILNSIGTVTLNNSTISGNSARGGGGIFNEGTLTLNNSTVSGNSATSSGGGIYNYGGTVTLSNTIVIGNSAIGNGGGITNVVNGNLTLIHSTVSSNSASNRGGGIENSNSATLIVQNSIVANSTAGGDCFNDATITVQFSLVEDALCGVVAGTNGNLTGDPGLDANLAPANAASIVVDAGSDALAVGSTDRAGNARIQGTRVDMGAFESAFTSTVSIAATHADAGEAGSDPGAFTVTRAGGSTLVVSLIIGGSAANGTDYTLSVASPAMLNGSTLTLPPGTNEAVITVSPTDDRVDEGSGETVVIEVGSDPTYTLGTPASATVTIADDDAAGITIAPISGLTTTEAGGTATFTVVLASQPTADVTLPLSSGDTTEGTVAPALLTFTPADWNTPQTVTVTGVDDMVDDGDVAYTIVTAPATSTDALYNSFDADDVAATNTDDDPQPTFNIDDVTQIEGDSGESLFRFTVTLSQPVPLRTQVDFRTADGTATGVSGPFFGPNDDYGAARGTFFFLENQTSLSVSIRVKGDTTVEPDETFNVILENPVNAIIGDGTGVGTLLNDDALPVVSIDSVTLAEGNAGTTNFTFNVTLNNPSTEVISVQVTTADGTAAAGSDYTTVSQTVNFPAGTTLQTVTVPVAGDTLFEAEETFTATLSNPTNAIIGTATATGTILNDDGQPALSVNNVANPEGNAGTTDFTFTVSLSGVSGLPVTATVNTVAVTANAPADYTAASGLVITFAPGETSKEVIVSVNGDTVAEGDETFTVNLSAPTNASIAAGTGTGTIQNDDTAGVTVAPIAGLVTIEAGGTATFTVVLASQPTADVTLPLSSSDTTEGTVAPASLTFTPADWNTPQTVTVTGVDDMVDDGDVAYTIVTAPATSTDPLYNAFDADDVAVSNSDNDANAAILIAPLTLSGIEGETKAYTITLNTAPSAGTVVVTATFDPAQLQVAGSSTGSATFTFTATNWNTPRAVSVFVVTTEGDNRPRESAISHAVSSSDSPEYPPGALATVTVSIVDLPPPPPTPLCEDHNFNEGGVVRASTADALGYAVNCRVLYQNGAPTTWLGNALYNAGVVGIEGVLNLGVQQAVDIFSPTGMTYFQGGAVFCLHGSGTLIWLAGRNTPRVAEIIGSYGVDEFPGFTCTTLFEPGTLVLVSRNPLAAE